MAQSLKNHNTFGIDATCNRIVEYHTTEDLQTILAELQTSGERWLHIGGGSNLLFVNPHFDGTVLHSGIRGIEVSDEDEDEVLLRVGAGEDWDEFVGHCVSRGWYGLENLSFIPGEVGASAVQNVGAYGVEAGDHIETVEGIAITPKEEPHKALAQELPELPTWGSGPTVIDHADCEYGYRTSVFKHALKGRFVVTHVWYRLSKHFKPVMTHAAVKAALESQGIVPEQATAKDIREAIIEVRRSKLPDPKETGSAGSYFMNPVVSAEKAEAMMAAYPSMPHYPAPDGVKIPAGWLIEQCGWKGRQEGHVGVHPKQALVLINCGGATGQEVADLATRITADVNERFGVEIHPEVLYIQ